MRGVEFTGWGVCLRDLQILRPRKISNHEAIAEPTMGQIDVWDGMSQRRIVPSSCKLASERLSGAKIAFVQPSKAARSTPVSTSQSLATGREPSVDLMG